MCGDFQTLYVVMQTTHVDWLDCGKTRETPLSWQLCEHSNMAEGVIEIDDDGSESDIIVISDDEEVLPPLFYAF